MENGGGNHIVRIKDATGCIDSVTVTLLQLYPDLDITLSQTPASCSIIPDGQVTAIASGGNGTYTYSQTGNNFQAGNVFITSHGDQQVIVKDGNGCTATTEINVALVNTVSIDAGTAFTICEGTSQVLNASSNATSFVWAPAISLNNATALQPSASPADTTRYYVTATLGVCTRMDSVDLYVRSAPSPNAGDDIAICYGKTVTLQGSGGVAFEWSPSTNTFSDLNNAQLTIKGLQTINYYLHVTDQYDCRSLAPDMIQVKVTPPLKLFAGNDTILTMNEPMRLNGQDLNNSGITQWNWSPAANLNNAGIQSPIALFTSPVLSQPYEYVYTLTGTTPEGCEGKDEIRIKVIQGPEIYVPTGFTPNNDGKNDELKPILAGIRELHFFNIYNRWGQLIFQTKNTSKGWDGRLKGVLENTSTYIWIAEGVDYRGNLVVRKGSVTLVR
ncbi:MAG: T9SS type B sorting domain-containing protein [Sphingobacteriales bacterium]|nr:MAG: T9SS type B sorting domain-containing protein [Sphingobacteriales bacterium]